MIFTAIGAKIRAKKRILSYLKAEMPVISAPVINK
jgi:hypothetical protein